MKKIFIHVGFHKTGTSSIQDTCAKYRDYLISCGFEYLQLDYAGKQINNHGVIIESIFSDSPELFDYNIRECLYGFELCKWIEKAKIDLSMAINNSKCENIIISGEAISTLKINELKRFKNYLESLDVDYEIICSVRSPYSFMCSDHQEVIKVNNAVVDNIFVRDKFTHAKNLKNTFADRIRFYSFEKACSSGCGLTNYFLKYIGCESLLGSHEEVRSNSGLNNLSTRLYSFLNNKHPNIVDGKLSSFGRGFDTIDLDNQKFLLTKSELINVRKELDLQNKLFFEEFGPEYCDVNYEVIDNTKINVEQAYKILDFHSGSNIIFTIFDFIDFNKDFSWPELIKFAFEKRNPDILRDIAIFDKTDRDISLSSITRALVLRPTGKIIIKTALSLTHV